jgi:hypothetical protein
LEDKQGEQKRTAKSQKRANSFHTASYTHLSREAWQPRKRAFLPSEHLMVRWGRD